MHNWQPFGMHSDFQGREDAGGSKARLEAFWKKSNLWQTSAVKHTVNIKPLTCTTDANASTGYSPAHQAAQVKPTTQWK